MLCVDRVGAASAAMLAVAAACGSVPEQATDAAVGDGAQGDGSATADAQQCFGAHDYTFCLAALPTLPVTITDGATLDTMTSTTCMSSQPTMWTGAGQPPACFVVGTTVTISNARIVGERPLVVLATNMVTVSGVLDAASHLNPFGTGPGVPYTGCGAFQAQPIDTSSGAAGGAGGSFTTRAGNGGSGNGTGAVSGGVSALAEASAPTKLRAGCDGQSGGVGTTNPSPGGRGYGGGAIFIVAGSAISLGTNAIINASGSGGGGGNARGGGGGGGSGGMIVLYAPTITANGTKLVANGGAGGTGATGTSVSQPNGSDPDPTSPPTPAPGVAGAAGTGIGGNGYATNAGALAGAIGSAGFGGGGGGGGAGYIQSNVALTGAIASPAVTVIP